MRLPAVVCVALGLALLLELPPTTAGGSDARAPAGRPERVRGGPFVAVLPAGWSGRVRATAGTHVLEAATRPLAPGNPLAALRLRPPDAVLTIAEVGNRPGTGGFRVVARPPRLRAGDVRRRRLVRGAPSVGVRFALRGRSFVIVAAFGSAPPAAAALRAANDLLRSLRIAGTGIDATTRVQLRRPLRVPVAGACRPAPSARVRAGIAWPVGRHPAYVALGAPRAVAPLADDRRRGGAYEHKTLWAFAPPYPGPLLVRALAAASGARLSLGSGRARELWLPAALEGVRRWRHAPSVTWIPAPGCYAFQVDGISFSRTIVFRARL